jgi:trk system potassium uptake protein TrkH
MAPKPLLKRIYGIKGSLLALSPVPFLFLHLKGAMELPFFLRFSAAAGAAGCAILAAFLLLRHPRKGKFLGVCASISSLLVLMPYLAGNPFAALLGSVAVILVIHTLLDLKTIQTDLKGSRFMGYSHTAQWGALSAAGVVWISLLLSDLIPETVSQTVILVSTLTAQALFVTWTLRRKSPFIKYLLTAVALFFAGLECLLYSMGHSAIASLLFAISALFLLSSPISMSDGREKWWESLFYHPARLLLFTFLFLCFLGTLLLVIPASTRPGHIALVDAAFTSVSAVCVTGLVVLDTPETFTGLGQALILLLIQLGGLGIMSIAAVAFQAMGRRLSIRHERVLTRMGDTAHRDLLAALGIIIKFTLVMEGIGALLLAGIFIYTGDTFWGGVWRGVFTAVSAFCNAGFALQSDSLVNYRSNPMVLHVVSLLIIFGGLAPATSLIFPKWISGKGIPAAPRIALITTAVMLASGTVFLLAFEWNGLLSGLSVMDKINNAWFQSVTLRTAGFNSVPIAGLAAPTFVVMIWFMFVGGSPGGTAGGVKTTTIGVLAMTFWSHINNRSSVLFQNRRLPPAVIYRAITMVASVSIIWFVVVIMLEVTQQIPARDIIFEATSAIGTVGLSTGATARLDEMGKVIVMMAMFAGRIGPMTLFMLLSEDVTKTDADRPDATINLT